MLSPKAPDNLPSRVAVGLLSPRSTLWIIARETPARWASSVSDQSRLCRSILMRAPMLASMSLLGFIVIS